MRYFDFGRHVLDLSPNYTVHKENRLGLMISHITLFSEREKVKVDWP